MYPRTRLGTKGKPKGKQGGSFMTVTLLGVSRSHPQNQHSAPQPKGSFFINVNQKTSSLASNPPRGSDFTQKNVKTLPALHSLDAVHLWSLVFPYFLPHSFQPRLSSLFAVSHTQQACASHPRAFALAIPSN